MEAEWRKRRAEQRSQSITQALFRVATELKSTPEDQQPDGL